MKKFLFVIFFLIFTQNLHARLVITHYSEYIKFNDIGQEVAVKIKAKAELPSRNLFYENWSYLISKNLNVSIIEAKVVGREYKVAFGGNNELRFTFDKILNGDNIEFNFKYVIVNNSATNLTERYNRQEFVGLPPFAAKARGSLIVEVPDNLEVYSFNPEFKQNGKAYEWNKTIPREGFSDIFYLTPKQTRWNIEVLTQVAGIEKPSRIDIKLPPYFTGGSGKIENFEILTNYEPDTTKIEKTDKNIEVNFLKMKGSIAQVKVKTTIENDLSDKVWLKFDPNNPDYSYIDQKLKNDLSPTIYDIQNISAQNQSPIYLEIAKWVHNNIKYDENYVGKNLPPMRILREKRGVCIEYSVLYDALLRAYGIPSIIVSGMSYNNETGEFELHAWNLVFVGGEWLSIDPTWGLYSGKLPASHIFFYLGDKNYVEYTIYDASADSFKSDIKRNIEEI